MKILDLDPVERRAEWLESRRLGVGASDIAAIIGVSPWTTAWQIWVDKIGAVPVDEDDSQTEAMWMGQEFETHVLDIWCARTGRHVPHRGVAAHHDEREWMRASFDGLETEGPTSDPGAAIQPIEVKLSDDWTWSDSIPLHYQAQGQWQMMVGEFDQMTFVVLHRGKKLESYVLEADWSDQSALLEAAERFWTVNVSEMEPPAVVAADASSIATLYPDHDDDEAVDVDLKKVRAYLEAKAQEKEAKEVIAQLGAEFKAQLGEAMVGRVGGEKVLSWKTQAAQRRPDMDRLKAEWPDVYAEIMPSKEDAGTQRVLRTHIKLDDIELEDDE